MKILLWVCLIVVIFGLQSFTTNYFCPNAVIAFTQAVILATILVGRKRNNV